MAQGFQMRTPCKFCGSFRRSVVVSAPRLGSRASHLPDNGHGHATKRSSVVANVYIEKKVVEGEEEYIYPGTQPEMLKEVCDKLFPPGDTNWGKFWDEDDCEDWYPKFVQAFQEAGGFDPTDPHRDPEPWEQMDWLYRATDYLKTRPDFAEFLPHGWAFPERAELDLPKDEPPCDTIGDELDRPWNQETNAVDLRARMEKRRYKTKQNEKWAKERARVGTSPGIDVVAGDVRLTEEERAMFELTDQEAWDFITQDGTAADPRDVLEHVEICNPFEKVDIIEEGVEFIEGVEDFAKRKGHWRESAFEIPTDAVDLAGAAYSEFMEAAGELPEAKQIE